MLYYNFKNYQEFQELFGIVEHGNGVKSRKNKILLSLLKSKELLHLRASYAPVRYIKYHFRGMNPRKDEMETYSRWEGDYARSYEAFLRVNSLSALRSLVYDWMRTKGFYCIELNGNTFRSDFYETDDFGGLCEDGDERSIRYRNIERDRIFKMRAGKFFRKLIDEKDFASLLPEAIKIWLAEDFAEEWKAYAAQNVKTSQYELHVDDNFSDIYDSSCLSGDFCSCMVNRNYHSYYENCVKAKAAYLTNDDDMIVARCIIFPEVHVDGSDKVLRLAERQYATDCNDTLKRQLIIALINAGEIDGYKRVGAGCSDNTAFVDINGNPLESTDLWIECYVDSDDSVSYQDSFRYYNEGRRKAYNCDDHNYDYDLATTEGTIAERNWSDYNDEYIPEDDAIWVETRDDYFWDHQTVYAEVWNSYRGYFEEESCFEEDCIEIGNTWYYAGENAEYPADHGLEMCPYCGDYFPSNDGAYYSNLTDEYYCCDCCLEEAEQSFKEDNWYYSEYDDEYYEDEDDVVTALEWDYRRKGYKETTIHVDTFESLCDDGCAVIFDGMRYIDDVIGYDGEPMHIVAAEFCAA